MGWRAPGPQPGDYLVLSPFNFANADAQSLPDMAGTWKLTWSSHSPFAVPNLSLRVAVKYIATRYILPHGGSEIGATNQFVYPVDYQILVRR
jgi:hypothetical protein